MFSFKRLRGGGRDGATIGLSLCLSEPLLRRQGHCHLGMCSSRVESLRATCWSSYTRSVGIIKENTTLTYHQQSFIDSFLRVIIRYSCYSEKWLSDAALFRCFCLHTHKIHSRANAMIKTWDMWNSSCSPSPPHSYPPATWRAWWQLSSTEIRQGLWLYGEWILWGCLWVCWVSLWS